MTNQQGAPEALPPAFIHYPPKKPELARVDFLPMATREERGNGWVTAALVEAQQPATHVQNPAEIAHVAGDVSKNGAESNMAQRPAPSAAAALPEGWVPLVITHEGQYPEEVAYGPQILMDRLGKWLRKYFDHVVASKAQPAPTPQADSQPAPVLDGTPPPCEQELFDQGVSVGLFDLPKWTVEEICRGIAAATGARVDWHYIGGRVHIKALPAARALEDSVTAPAGGVDDDVDAIALARYKVVPAHESMFHRFAVVAGDGKQQLYLGHEIECANMARKFAGAFLDGAFYQANIAPTPPAQAADSVLEDAARGMAAEYQRWIDFFHAGNGSYDDFLRIELNPDAARKQGGA